MILDTSFISALREDDAARALAGEHEDAGLPQRVPTVVIAELYAGVGKGDRPYETATDYEELIANLPVVPLDENVARTGGALAGLHAASDTLRSLGLADAMIAATGLVQNEPVVTADVDDFGSVDGLDVVTW